MKNWHSKIINFTYVHNRIKKHFLRLLILKLIIYSFILTPFGAIPVHALDAPDLVTPLDNIVTTVDNYEPLGIPEFKWKPVAGAESYRLQISNNIGFSTTIVDIKTANISYTPTTASVFPDGDYYWRVRVETPTPIGPYSDIWSFTKQWATDTNLPALDFPVDDATIDFYDDPIFSWERVTGAAEYKFQIYTSEGGWSTPTYTATTLATSHQPKDKLANGSYYWRVVPVDPGNHDGTPSEERSFNADYNPELIFLAPDDGATPTFTPTFRWTAVRGAQYYRLQYSTDPSFGTDVTQIDTRNTSSTPTITLPNDVNYYWRVRVISGKSLSDWTLPRTFVKKWYIQPVLLTPTNLYQHQRFPLFSWTPVPGASYYKVEISKSSGFSPLVYTGDNGNTANTFYSPSKYDDDDLYNTYYWRVTPYDGNGKAGKTSNTSSYRSYKISTAPELVYPPYYYLPDTYTGFPDTTTNPHEERTVPLPIFMWHRSYIGAGESDEGQIYAEAYRLQVSIDPTFSSVNWTIDTENLVATPTLSNPFTPLVNTDYYWHVRPLIGGVETGQWSQVWKARFDPSLGLEAKVDESPQLLRPTNGSEFAETTPLLEWFPIDGVESYEVEISLNSTFSNLADTVIVTYPTYAPTQSLAQRSLGYVDFPIYYWRVRQSPDGPWSETRRFQVAAQSQWQSERTLGDVTNQLQIGSDPLGDITDSDYELTTLYMSQASGYWHIGFHVPTSPSKNITYGLYLDIDHQEASGATSDARGYNVTAIPGYRPEYAIYVLQESGAFNPNKTYLYHWNGIGWDTVNILSAIGGEILHTADYLEMKIPNTAIGYQDDTGSYAISLFSLASASSTLPKDSVPSDPEVPGTGEISRFANVTELLNLVMPPNNAGEDPSTYPSLQPFFWDLPVHAPISGVNLKTYLDPEFTSEVGTFTYSSDTAFYAQTSYAWKNDIEGDNTYFWRVQPRYRVGYNLVNGAWSQGRRFERAGFIPQNLNASVTFATPTFSWDVVEGAEFYELQVSTQENFGTTVIDIDTRQTSYTHTSTLANGKYYWHVRTRRYGNVINDWSQTQEFTLDLLKPTGLLPENGSSFNYTPTLCWNEVTDPVFAAWKYRVQVSKDPLFSSTPFDTIDTEQSCWTPTKGYDDGTYYWRVATIDGNGKLGNFSENNNFTKIYPTITLLSPTNGAIVSETPTFIWEPVDGAAQYKLEVSLFENFSPTVETVTTNNTRYTSTKVYKSPQKYYWRVAMIDIDRKYGPFDVYYEFIYDPFPNHLYLPLIIK